MNNEVEVKEAFVALGYKPSIITPAYEPAYTKCYKIGEREFTIQFSSIDFSLQKLPKAYVLSISKDLGHTQLPHLNANKSICLFDEESLSFNPLDPKGLIASCVKKVEEILILWNEGDYKSSIEEEFSNYWNPKLYCYLITEKSHFDLYSFDRNTLSSDMCSEYVLAEDIKQAERWMFDREGNNLSKAQPAITIDLKESAYVPFEQNWPPENLKGVIEWLEKTNQGAYQALISKIVSKVTESNLTIIFFHASEIVGLRVFLSKEALQAICRLKNNETKKRKSRKGNISRKNLIACLKGANSSLLFERMRVDRASDEYIVSRNNANDFNLVNKKIAVIGCGTVGGYTAESLSKIGAGTGHGSLYLFDGDTLVPGNLGRHLLGKRYLFESKSEGLRHHLLSSGVTSKVIAKDEFIKENVYEGWDYIVDATGHKSLSVLLSKWIRTIPKPNRPILVHGWVDAYGLMSRAIIDDGKSACYTCLDSVNGTQCKSRFELFKKGIDPESFAVYRRACGASYLPYASAVSMSVGALVQYLITSSKVSQISFVQHDFSKSVKSAKQKYLLPTIGCPVCQISC